MTTNAKRDFVIFKTIKENFFVISMIFKGL